MSAIVDIHCHTFNGDDLPVRGFIQRVVFRNLGLAADVAALADVVLRAAAPGYVTERRELDRLLEARAGRGALEAPVTIRAPIDLDEEAQDEFQQLVASEPALMTRIEMELSGPTVGPAAHEGLVGGGRAAFRAVKWVKLFGLSRLEVARQLLRNFGDGVDLYTPLLVDLGMGLFDVESTTLRQQMELQEKISRLSMLGRLGQAGRGHVHPFMGFDPRRELRARRSGDIETPLQMLRVAVEQYGFVGVKLYPPMGWRPLRNQPTREMTPEEASEIDEILRELYRWCEQADVPVTAHCNASNAAHKEFLEFSAPELWAHVLREFPGLHLNLGHFGGAKSSLAADDWAWRIADLATDKYPYLFADVGNHRVDRRDIAEGYLKGLAVLFTERPGIRERLMYGSDWFMLALLPEHRRFLERYDSLYRKEFGDEETTQFLGGAALRFLGFDDPGNQNAQRLRRRYETYAPDRIPRWLAA